MTIEYTLNLDLIILVSVSMVALVIVARYLSRGSSYLRQRIKDRETEIVDWKHKFNVMNGKFHRMEKGELIDKPQAESVLKSSKMSDAIPTLLQSASEHLPKGLSTIARNPQVQGWLKGLADKYPTEAKELLARYLPQLTQIGSKTQGSTEVSRL